MASEHAYQSEINGSNDFLIVNLDHNGHRNWSTYYGGNMDERYVLNIGYDKADNLYLYGFGTSQDLATDGALLETPYIEEDTGFENYFLTRFSPNPDASIPTPDSPRFQVYPNPATDLLQIRSGTLDTTITALEVYYMSGKCILHPALPPQAQQSIDVSALPSGVYLLKIYSADQSQNVRFVKR